MSMFVTLLSLAATHGGTQVPVTKVRTVKILPQGSSRCKFREWNIVRGCGVHQHDSLWHERSLVLSSRTPPVDPMNESSLWT
jgi:hypothetical protein